MSVLLFLSLLRWKLWRWKRLSPWLVRYPDLTGTWRGYSESGFFGEELDGHFVGDRIGLVLTVDQQFDRITFKAYHPDSWNNGISSCFDGSAAAYRMFVVYKNHTSSQHDPNASDHLGCFVFDLHDIGMDRGRWHIEGRYWTDKERPRGTGSRDRGTHGKIAASWWKKPILSKAEAQPEAKRYLHDMSSVRGDPALTRAASAPSGPTGTLPREGA